MKNITLITSLLLVSISFGYAQKNQYIDLNPPGKESKVFAPGVVSLESRYEFGSVFSPNGREFFFAYVEKGKNTIMAMYYEEGQWSAADTVLHDEIYGFNDPFLSPDGDRLYYISNYREDEDSERGDIDIWYSERQADGRSWSAPINAGRQINSVENEYYISFNQQGTMYFATNYYDKGNFDIYRSAFKNGSFQPAEKLGPAVNTGAYEADVFVAPDESYLIFAAGRDSNIGLGDLYISFRKNGKWTQSKNMGPLVNSAQHELCPFVTYDGKYLLYTSGGDIRWISTEVFDDLR